MIIYTHHNDASDPLYGTVTQTTVADPPKPTVIDVTSFKKRFTLAERAGIMGSADNMVRAFLDELNTASSVNLLDADTIAGVNYLESTAALIAAGRATQVLTP